LAQNRQPKPLPHAASAPPAHIAHTFWVSHIIIAEPILPILYQSNVDCLPV
jgi:hypothetical protein